MPLHEDSDSVVSGRGDGVVDDEADDEVDDQFRMLVRMMSALILEKG